MASSLVVLWKDLELCLWVKMSQMLCGLHGSSVSQATCLEKACVILCHLLMIPSFSFLLPLWMRPSLICCEELTLNISSFNARFLTGWLGPADVWSCRIFHTRSVIFKLSTSCSRNKPCLYRTGLFSRNMRLNTLAEPRWPDLQCGFVKLTAYPVCVSFGKFSGLPALTGKVKDRFHR